LRNATVRSGTRVSSRGLLALLRLAICSSGNGGGTNPPPAASAGISPTAMSLNEGGTESFTASVQNDSNSAGLTSSIGSGVGTLSTSTTGVPYTAPAVISGAATITPTSETLPKQVSTYLFRAHGRERAGSWESGPVRKLKVDSSGVSSCRCVLRYTRACFPSFSVFAINIQE